VQLYPAVAPQRIAVSSTAVYWTTASAIQKVNLAGPAMFATSPLTPSVLHDVAVNSAGAPFVATPTPTKAFAGCTSDLTTCSPYYGVDSTTITTSITVDTTTVYVGLSDDGFGAGVGGINTATFVGTTPASYLVNEHVLDLRLTSANTKTYWRVAGAIHYGDKGSSVWPAVTIPGVPNAFFIYQDQLIAATTGQTIYTCTLASTGDCAGGTTRSIGAAKMPVTAVVADANGIYWIEGGANGSVVRCKGSSCDVIATNQASPTDIALDATNVYWSNDGGGIMKRGR